MTEARAAAAAMLARQKRLERRWLTLAGNRVGLAVTAAATTLTVTLSPAEFDIEYGVSAMPNWGTTVWVTSKQLGQFTLNFGTAAPGSATVDVATFREV